MFDNVLNTPCMDKIYSKTSVTAFSSSFLPFFKICSNFVHFCPILKYFGFFKFFVTLFCPCSENSHACPCFLEQALGRKNNSANLFFVFYVEKVQKHHLLDTLTQINSIISYISHLTFAYSKLSIEPIAQEVKLCSKLTIKTPKRRHWCRSNVFIINFEHVSHLAPVSLLFTLSR